MTPRQGTTIVTLAVLFLILIVMAVWGFSEAAKPFPPLASDTEPSPCSKAETVTKTKIGRKDVTVSVYNSSGRKGLATETLVDLEDRHFHPGEAANAPDGVTVATVEVWSTRENDPKAKLVAAQFGPDTHVVHSDVELGPGIDVIVGKGYTKLAKGAVKTMALPAPETSCVQVD